MKKFKDLNREEKIKVKDFIFERNCVIASHGFLGFEVKKLKPSKQNLEKFKKQFTGHPLCGCFACLELAKTFVVSNQDIKEEVIFESMKDLDSMTIED